MGFRGDFWPLWETKNARIRKIRTQDTRYHPTFACGEYTTGALTADDALIAKRKQPWGGKSAHSITGVPGFSYVYRFSRHYGGIHEGSISGVCGGENVISEKRLRDHFHEHCESLTPTGFSLRAMASCTPSHQRDMDIGIDDIDSIAHAAVVCQEGARKKARQKDFLFTQKSKTDLPGATFWS